MKDENFGVAPGQRYRPAGSTYSTWEVVSIIQPPGEPVAHAHLARVGAPKDLKTVALRVLRDRRFFEFVR